MILIEVCELFIQTSSHLHTSTVNTTAAPNRCNSHFR